MMISVQRYDEWLRAASVDPRGPRTWYMYPIVFQSYWYQEMFGVQTPILIRYLED